MRSHTNRKLCGTAFSPVISSMLLSTDSEHLRPLSRLVLRIHRRRNDGRRHELRDDQEHRQHQVSAGFTPPDRRRAIDERPEPGDTRPCHAGMQHKVWAVYCAIGLAETFLLLEGETSMQNKFSEERMQRGRCSIMRRYCMCFFRVLSVEQRKLTRHMTVGTDAMRQQQHVNNFSMLFTLHALRDRGGAGQGWDEVEAINQQSG